MSLRAGAVEAVIADLRRNFTKWKIVLDEDLIVEFGRDNVDALLVYLGEHTEDWWAANVAAWHKGQTPRPVSQRELLDLLAVLRSGVEETP
jgi:hypothetical protein